MARNDKYSYNDIPNMQTDWAKDPANGKQFSGESVQKFIKGQLTSLGEDIADAEVRNPSIFGGFVDDVSLKNTDAGSNYVKIVYDVTRHMFFAVTMEGDVEKYHRQYDKWAVYNDGDFPNAYPYEGKVYVYGGNVYQFDGEALVCSLISQEEFNAIFPPVEMNPKNIEHYGRRNETN